MKHIDKVQPTSSFNILSLDHTLFPLPVIEMKKKCCKKYKKGKKPCKKCPNNN